ncbi:hypothetical protein PF005_g16336 [Phytophthora fragariae]|uniref:Uncharacterized protein n=1 Tax=Phytophthora fragariae TaxID=53985 RepID=A0A6A3JRE9_9STRA|nr:hypothetical protein PF003_g35462 [Phytophthora fragariae]KAE8932049.1 hypothetical protein PF009_g17907 [Phytophthora fragariae]KAE8997710.1 hypothetical protein PF011_g15362 [Phytophthora fragariae]KAE9096786.1 hypothetical protein PF007_g16860 [Phytophthora fragariae]KAE9096948.1 hypothetical protein PF010_g16144 [Phytophthora fragariae]
MNKHRVAYAALSAAGTTTSSTCGTVNTLVWVGVVSLGTVCINTRLYRQNGVRTVGDFERFWC